MSFPFQIVGFDLDGTLVDSSGDLTAAVNHALAEAGRAPLTVDQVRPMIGGGSRHMLRQGMDATGGCTEDELDRLQALLLAHYEANIANATRPFPGCLEALDALAARGATLAVVTNKYEHLARLVLQELGMTRRFATIIGGDTLGLGRGKPAPDLLNKMVADCGNGRAAFVGDSIYDVRAARAAGLPSVAVSFGFLTGPADELEADALIDGYPELVAALEGLGTRTD